MSYTFTISFKGGLMTVNSRSGDMPDGTWQVGGHEDEYGAGINVVRRLPNGRFAAEAQHHSTHRNYDDNNFIQYPVAPPAPADGVPDFGKRYGPTGVKVDIKQKTEEADEQDVAYPDGPKSHKIWDNDGHGYQIIWRNSSRGPEYDSMIDAHINRANDLAALDVPQPDGERYQDHNADAIARADAAASRDIYPETGQPTDHALMICGKCQRVAFASSAPCPSCPDYSGTVAQEEQEWDRNPPEL
jgi:hypothetical protein